MNFDQLNSNINLKGNKSKGVLNIIVRINEFIMLLSLNLD